MWKLLVALSVITLFVWYADAKGELILPRGMAQEDYCKGCIATVEAISQRKKDGMSAKKIISKVNKMCSSLAGDKNRTTCHHLIENHNHDLENIIRDVEKLQEMKTWFCHEHTFACIGVSMEKRARRCQSDFIFSLAHRDNVPANFEKKEMTDEELLAHIAEHVGPIRTPNPVRATDEL